MSRRRAVQKHFAPQHGNLYWIVPSTKSSARNQQWQKGTAADSALELLAVVRSQVYRLPASGEITGTYVEAARAVIRTRLTQAGMRLAWLINQTFQ